MTTVNTLKKGLDRKVWQQMTFCPTANAAGMFTIANPTGWDPEIMYVASASTIYIYNTLEDAWILLPGSGIAGTFAAGACGLFHCWAATGTATAGSITTITTNLTFNRSLAGYMVRITGGTNAGQQRLILSNTLGANSVITVTDAFGAAIDNTSVYQLATGRYWFFNAGTTAVGFRYYDRATNAWTSRSVVGLPTAWGTDGKIVSHCGCRTSRDLNPTAGLPIISATPTTVTTGQNFVVNQLTNRIIYIISGTGVGQYRKISSNTSTIITISTAWAINPDATSRYYIEGLSGGFATSSTNTTLVDATKTWTASQWINFQIRIVAGTGAGQVRIITANDATSVTVAAWTANPDVTSIYLIEGDDNAMYLLGNASVTMYEYSISGDSWSTLAPGVARAAVPGTGMSSNIVFENTNSVWTNDSIIINGRRLYSFRGGAGAVLDYYDIPSNTWTNAITYLPATETFTTGSSWDIDAGIIFGTKDATGRIYRFDPAKGTMTPVSTLIFPNSTATLGDKMFFWTYIDGDTTIKYLYYLSQTLTNLFRLLII